MEDIARQNGKEVGPEILQAYKETAQQEFEQVQNIQLTFLDLFKTPILRANVFLMIANWSLTSMLFESNLRNVENLPFSIYVTYTIYSFFEFPSDIAAIWGLEILGRRWSACLSLLAFSLTSFICIFSLENSIVITVMGMIGRLFIIYAMNVAAQLSLEVVPTQLRGQGNALANVCAQISNFFAPQIVYSKVHDPSMPFILMCSFAVLASINAFFLPETAGIKLPDSINEAEILFKRQTAFSFQRSGKIGPAEEQGCKDVEN